MQVTCRSIARAAVLTAGLILSLTAGAQVRGGSVTVGVEQDIPGFDPLVIGIYDTGAMAAAAVLFDTLTRLDDDGTVQPRLATSWTHSPDFKTWTFKLREGVKFQDGTPFNAQAVASNYRRMIDPDNHCACAFYLSAIARVEAADDMTVVYHLRNPSVKLPALLSPPTVTNVFHSPAAIKERGKDYNRHPVGTGPFRLVSWQSGGELVFERNPGYWRKGHPYLDKVVVRPMRDPNARMAAVRAGDVDIIWHDIADDVVKARADDSLTVREFPASGVSAVVFNLEKPPLDDVRVRQALRYAMDLEAFTQSFMHGLMSPATDPYGPGSGFECRDVGALHYDPAKARTLLKEYGKPVRLRYMVTAEPRGQAVGQIFQAFWEAVGVRVTLDPVDQTTFVNRSFVGDFQIGGWRIIDLADPDPQMYADFRTGSVVNISNYSNAKVDRLLEEARNTADTDRRIAAYCDIARELNHDLPWIWVTNNHYFSIARIGLRGVHKQYSDVVDVADAWWAQD